MVLLRPRGRPEAGCYGRKEREVKRLGGGASLVLNVKIQDLTPKSPVTPKSPAMVYACAGWMGTKMRKVAPRPDVLSTSMKPPCSRTMP